MLFRSTGNPGQNVNGISLRDIVIRSMGTGTSEYAKKPVPERPDAYAQNNMYGYTLPAHGLYVRHAENLTLENIQLYADAPDVRPAMILEDVSNVRLNNFQGDNPSGELPFMKIIDGSKISISGFRQNKNAPVNFLECVGNSRKIELLHNDFEGVKRVVKAADGAVIQK